MNGPTHGGVVCSCGRIMVPKKNSVSVEELLEDGRPYKLWSADLYACPECGVEVITGFARVPLVEHYRPEYFTVRERRGPIYPARSREAS